MTNGDTATVVLKAMDGGGYLGAHIIGTPSSILLKTLCFLKRGTSNGIANLVTPPQKKNILPKAPNTPESIHYYNLCEESPLDIMVHNKL